jgi:predicted transposase YbfD/YdcC
MIGIDSRLLLKHFANIPDPRKAKGQLHRLTDIIVISILAVISGADTFVDMEIYAKAKEPWLRTFLELPNGIPSHDTFRWIFSILKPSLWQTRFINWVQELEIPAPILNENQEVVEVLDVMAIDGKTARRSRNANEHGLHTVSIWSVRQGIVIAQLEVPEKSNEITAIPEIIENTCVEGGIVTIDAMGCQKNIAWSIRENKADYVLNLKKNQADLLETVTWLFDDADSIGWKDVKHDYFLNMNKKHGREETRRCWVLSDLSVIEEQADWRDLRCVVRLEATRVTRKGTSVETRYYLTSLDCDAKKIGGAIRLHWGIENSLHYVLDMSFTEDMNRTQERNSQANLVTVRHIALNLLSLDRSSRMSMKGKRKTAGWDENYLLEVLGFRL